MSCPQIAIIGAGFSGISLAINLQRLCKFPLEVLVFGTPEDFSLGKAYSTMSSSHVLNVVAGNMSMFPDLKDDFVQWLSEHPETQLYTNQSNQISTSYVPRMLYGQYIQTKLAIAKNQPNSLVEITLIPQTVTSISKNANTFILNTSLGAPYTTDYVVLAMGNAPPNPLFPKLKHPLYFSNPWNYQAIESIPNEATILLIGSGLTMIDICLTLQDKGFKGRVHSFSPRGLLPQPHIENCPKYTLDINQLPDNLLARLKYSRELIKKLPDWRCFMNACRPHIQKMWTSLTEADQKRFLRHLVLFWDTHRHRIAPRVTERLKNLQEQEILSIHKAWVQDINVKNNEFTATIRPRGENKSYELDFDAVVNCTGPMSRLSQVQDTLYNNLFTQGLVSEGPLNMGLQIDTSFRCINQKKETEKKIFALGSLCKGNLWEIIAVPDLRDQSYALAHTLLQELNTKESV